jgi:hypothetical protein
MLGYHKLSYKAESARIGRSELMESQAYLGWSVLLLLVSFAIEADECSLAEGQSDWLFCEDFESGALDQWIDVTGLTVSTSAENAQGGNHSVALFYPSGSTGAGWMWAKGLRPHSANTDAQYIRWWQKWQTGFEFQSGSGDQKIFMLDALDPENEWGQTANWKLYLHMADSGAAESELVVDRYIQAGDQWEVYRQNRGQVEFATDRWYCIEAEVKHNTPRQNDGRIRIWIDDAVVLDHSNVRLRDDATSWNAIQLNGWYDGAVPRDQSSWIDQIIVSTQRIGCGSVVRPNPPTDLTAS